MKFEELAGLSVSVDQVVFLPHMVAPPEKPYPFAYYLSIRNESQETVTILGRKWIVTDRSGHTLVVEGEGVVGVTPLLEPGESFSYNSYHVISEASSASGTFFGKTEAGSPIYVRIPEFQLDPPIDILES